MSTEIDASTVDVNTFQIADIRAHARTIARGNTVVIFDTTLRDGEQSPGATLNTQEKLDIAQQLARLGVDIMEAGFPAASPGDLEAVRQIANSVGRTPRRDKDGNITAPPIVAGLARANKNDIDKAWQAVQGAIRPRIHTFLATSDIHMEHKLRMSRDEVLETVGDMVQYAASLCQDVEFSPEDAGRSDPAFLVKVLEVAIQAGATTLNIPDTVGYTTPEEYGALIRHLRENVPGGQDVIFSLHCHNDLGLATANTLAGIKAGARQIEVTLNGIGERAGNTSLEETVMALHTRKPVYGLETNIVTTELHRASDMVSRYTGIVIQPNKAIVGANAFAHEAGIHQDGMLKHKRTYEIMDASLIGLNQSKLVLGKHSGRHALQRKLEELGFHLEREELQEVFKRFKELADKKKTVSDADLEALVGDEIYQPVETWELLNIQVQCGIQVIPTAVVTLRNNQTGEQLTVDVKALQEGRLEWSTGDGESGTLSVDPDEGLKVETGEGTVRIGQNVGDAPEWIPLPSDVDVESNFSSHSGDTHAGALTFETSRSVDEIAAFYRDAFESRGYTLAIDNTLQTPDGKQVILSAQHESRQINLAVVTGDPTTVQLQFSDGG